MRSTILRELLSSSQGDIVKIREDLEKTMIAAWGPLVEPINDDASLSLVTFICIGPTESPVVSSAVFSTVDEQWPMELLPGTTDIWWAEVAAPSDTSVAYRFQRHRIAERGDESRHSSTTMLEYIRALFDVSFADRFNPDLLYPMAAITCFGADEIAPELDKWDSVLTLPDAKPYQWDIACNVRGSIHNHLVHSEVFGNSRHVTVWTPPGYFNVKDPLPVVVLLDGEAFQLAMDALLIFDNLVAGGHAPPFIAVLVHNATPISRITEYPCDPLLGEFIADELLPLLRDRYRISDDPSENVIGGFSYGALAAVWVGFSRPGIFGNVLSMSASLWWHSEWLTEEYRETELKPIRFWIAVGLLESHELPFTERLDMISVTRRFRDLLMVKGYEITGYRQQPGGHDFVNWRQALPMGLIALLN